MKHKEIMLLKVKNKEISHFNMSNLITVIGNSCFEGSSLVNIKFSNTLEIIKDWTFYNCRKLKNIDFTNCINLREIGESVFCDCHELEKVYIPNKVKLYERVFWDCISLERVRLPNDLEIIPSELLRGCRKLTSIKISNVVEKIEEYAFFNSGINELNIPKKVRFSKEGHESIKVNYID